MPQQIMDAAHRESSHNRSACTECQRRKQKCNREWPCDRCHKRKIADQCRYSVPSPPVNDDAIDVLKLEGPKTATGTQADQAPDARNGEFDTGLQVLASHLFETLGIGYQNKEPVQLLDYVEANSSIQLDRLLELLPRRQKMDELIHIFIHDVNYHYYIIYPPVFLQDYKSWWEKKTQKQPISLQWTCLLAMICACATQHLDDAVRQTFEAEIESATDAYSEELHNAGRELASLIPAGRYHFHNVQRLLHSCYWYKAEAKFPEAWHVLNAAILEARELGFHKEAVAGKFSDFDVEMRRRLWCVLDTWDWQISSGLGRPIIIDRAECNTKLPVLTLEGYAISPLLHMKMQAQLTRELNPKFPSPKDIATPQQIIDYKGIVEGWVQRFPPEYHAEHPDKTWDTIYPWVFPHRFYVFTMACLMILNPVRTYMVQQYTPNSPPDELEVRAIGIEYSLKVMKTLREWVDSLSRRDGRLHFIIFSIFDTAAILCTALIKNPGHPIPEQENCLLAITDAVAMLKRLNKISKTSKASHTILCKLVRRLPQRPLSNPDDRQKRAKISAAPPEKTPPEKTPPEKTPPEKTPPEKTPPAKTPPEKTAPAKTSPDKTLPVNTLSEKTPPMQVPPVNTLSEKTPPVNTLPAMAPEPAAETEKRTTLPVVASCAIEYQNPLGAANGIPQGSLVTVDNNTTGMIPISLQPHSLPHSVQPPQSMHSLSTVNHVSGPDFSNGDFAIGNFANGSYSNGNYANGNFSNDNYANNNYANNNYANNSYANNNYANNNYANNSYANNTYANNTYANNNFSNDNFSNGSAMMNPTPMNPTPMNHTLMNHTPMSPTPMNNYMGYSLPPAPPIDFVSMPTQPMPLSTYQPLGEEPMQPDFALENMPAGFLGELGPIWDWHSSNLNFDNGGNAVPPPPANGYDT